MDLYFSVINYRIYPIIPALFLILFPSYYSKNYSSIMCACLNNTGVYVNNYVLHCNVGMCIAAVYISVMLQYKYVILPC